MPYTDLIGGKVIYGSAKEGEEGVWEWSKPRETSLVSVCFKEWKSITYNDSYRITRKEMVTRPLKREAN